jgi:acyl carrier protein/NAD(P)-dependent dehydrogenase (short-subunit alcohol dehydrogenase family)
MGINTLPPNAQLAPPDEHLAVKLHKLAHLERQVEHLSIYTGSLTDPARLTAFFDKIRRQVGAICGVIHSAGIISDPNQPALVAKDCAHIAAVLEPKITGLETLVKICAPDALDFFVAFSSLTGLIPRFAKGNCDYALANTYIDTFMAYQNLQLHNPGYKAITWVDWHETGMATKVSPKTLAAMQRNLDKIGLFTHPNEMGKALFESALGQKAAWVLNTDLDPIKFAAAAPNLLYAHDGSVGSTIANSTINEVTITDKVANKVIDQVTDEVADKGRNTSILRHLEQWEAQPQSLVTPAEISAVISLEEIQKLQPQLIHRIYRLLFPTDTVKPQEAVKISIREHDKVREHNKVSAPVSAPVSDQGRVEISPKIDANPASPPVAAWSPESLAKLIETIVLEVLKLNSIDQNQYFQNYGLDSISATQLAIKLEKHLAREILPQWLLNYPTVVSLAQHLSQQQ